jgi:hypothetical protein
MLLLHFGTVYLNLLFVTHLLALLRSSLVSKVYCGPIVENSVNSILPLRTCDSIVIVKGVITSIIDRVIIIN